MNVHVDGGGVFSDDDDDSGLLDTVYVTHPSKLPPKMGGWDNIYSKTIALANTHF